MIIAETTARRLIRHGRAHTGGIVRDDIGQSFIDELLEVTG